MLTTLTLAACLASSSFAHSVGSFPDTTRDNANRIFNSIHHAMRQWGSSLDHNGMSMFVATVPEATEFYHGTSSPHRINETEWLAFEPEHALVFASCGPPDGGKHPRPPPKHAANTDGERPDHPARRRWNPDVDVDQSLSRNMRSQQPFISPDAEPCNAYLHTYRTNKQLRLLYVDGQSAAKSDKGTLDVQDLILRDSAKSFDAPAKQPRRRPGGPPGEQVRALELCQSAERDWQGKIDGVLRMEAGFEIILCSFEDNLDVGNIEQQETRGGRGPGSRDVGDQLSYYQAVAARFDGIGGNRVSVDYSSFVSVFAYPHATSIDDADLPRVVNESSTIARIREDVDHMLTSSTAADSDNIDWQAITDLIVGRYAHRIAALTTTQASSLATLQAGLDRALRPFINYGNRNRTNEVARCATQFLSPEAIVSRSTAAIAIKETYKTICQTLSDAAAIDTLEEAVLLIENLQQWLGWTIWKRCAGCQIDEVCMVPIWPWGSKKDFEHPSCSNMTNTGPNDYWGGFHGAVYDK